MRAKNYGGTIRTCPPKKTLELIKPLIKTAQITRLANLTQLDCIGVPVYTCIRPASKNLATSQGKGITHELAMCSAYMESLEHYYSESVQVNYQASMHDIQQCYYLHPHNLPTSVFTRKLDDQRQYQWSLGKELYSRQDIYIPSSFLRLDSTKPGVDMGLFRISTDGLASGNTFVEALCHGLYEAIERHAVACFDEQSSVQKSRYALDINTIEHQSAATILRCLQEKQIETVVYDITAFAFGIPTFCCVIANKAIYRHLAHFSGFGTHLHKGVAICRALTEAIQSRLTYIAGSRDDIEADHYQVPWSELKGGGVRDYRMISHSSVLELEEQKMWLLECLQSHGYQQVIVYQHTPNHCPISVVRVIVPGFIS